MGQGGSVFATKSIESLKLEAERAGEHSLRRVLGPRHLVMLGIGDIIGAGIFVLTGLAAAQYGGPAIVLSFLLAALACGFAGLCYSEFAAMMPVSGSAYTYAYATLGELAAWTIGCALTLEFALGPGHGGRRLVGLRGEPAARLRDHVPARPRRAARERCWWRPRPATWRPWPAWPGGWPQRASTPHPWRR